MFTGIVEGVGKVLAVDPQSGGMGLTLSVPVGIAGTDRDRLRMGLHDRGVRIRTIAETMRFNRNAPTRT